MKDFTLEDIKRIVSQAEHGATGDQFIDYRYNHHETKFNHTEPYYRVFYHLAKFLEPKLTVELGGWQGTAAAHFASGYEGGGVITIDHHGDPGDDMNKSLMQAAENRYLNLVYIQDWTWNALQIVKQYNTPIDILFIDSWHQYEYAMRDWNDYSPLLASPSLVICDDIMKGDGPVIAGMQRFWDELPGQKWLDEGTIHRGIPMGFIKYES
jgi:predicted O-methyltransferase YrrM